MSLSRLRKGELLAAAGSLVLLFVMFTDWAAPDVTLFDGRATLGDNFNQSGWSALGWFMVLLIVLTTAGALLLVVLTAVERDTPVLAVVAFVWTSALGIITSVALLIRLTIAQPGLANGLSNGQVDIRGVAWIGWFALVATTAGAWIAMGDERTEAATSAAPEVPVRPAPPATA